MQKMITANRDDVYVDLSAINTVHASIHRNEPVSIINVGSDMIKIKTPKLKDLLLMISEAKKAK